MTANRHDLTTAAVQGLLVDTNPWLSCDDCFRLVDQYVELLLGDPGADMPAMHAHLAGCPACAEEAITLLELAAQDSGIDPARALQVLSAR